MSVPDSDARRDAAGREALARAARGGLCAACAHARPVVSSRGSAFLRCVHPELPKYPPQPIGRCSGFVPAERR